MKLDSNITLRDLWRNGQLNQANEYLRQVFTRYREISRDLGECTIRIGLVGKGYAPNYSIQPVSPPKYRASREAMMTGKASSEEERIALVYSSNRFAIYNGRSHKRLDLNRGQDGQDRWSQSEMTLRELQSLRQEVSDHEKKATRTNRRV